MLSGEDLDREDRPDTDEHDNFYLIEQSDVGYDSAEEEHIWIWLGDLAKPFDEDQLMKDFVPFKSGSRRESGNTTFTRFLFTVCTTSSCWSEGKVQWRQEG